MGVTYVPREEDENWSHGYFLDISLKPLLWLPGRILQRLFCDLEEVIPPLGRSRHFHTRISNGTPHLLRQFLSIFIFLLQQELQRLLNDSFAFSKCGSAPALEHRGGGVNELLEVGGGGGGAGEDGFVGCGGDGGESFGGHGGVCRYVCIYV